MTAVLPTVHARRRPPWAFVLALAGLSGLGWAWSFHLAEGGHHGLSLAARVAMWTTMMLGMMVPPEVLALSGLARSGTGRARGQGNAWVMLAGYLAVWSVGSVALALIDAQLGAWGLMTHDMALRSTPLAAGILVAAGLVQLSPWKAVCVERCRALSTAVGDGSVHPLRAGLRHGVVSLCSCGVLMLTLLVVGAMNVAGMVLLTAFLILERVTTPGVARVLGRAGGVGLLVWGGWLALRAVGS